MKDNGSVKTKETGSFGGSLKGSQAASQSKKSLENNSTFSFIPKKQPKLQLHKVQKNSQDYSKPEISDFQMIRLTLTPFCCRTKYQKSLKTLITKAEYKLHREIDFGPFLKRLRDTQNMMKSYASSKIFDANDLFQDYQVGYSNTINISRGTNDSLEDEFAEPFPINYT